MCHNFGDFEISRFLASSRDSVFIASACNEGALTRLSLHCLQKQSMDVERVYLWPCCIYQHVCLIEAFAHMLTHISSPEISDISKRTPCGYDIETRGEFNNARARRALVDWYLSLFRMCKA